MRLFSKLITLSFLFSINYLEANNYTQDYIDPYTHSVNGGIGLIEVPNARFSNDGEFGFGVSLEEPFNRVYGKVQIFPWMEAVLRYTEGQFRPYSKGSGQTWKDKGIDFKFRLMQESENFPQIAVGVVDLGGTGAYGSEYIVASKKYNNFDVSAGLGWGRLNGKEHLDNIFWWRENSDVSTGLGGLIQLDRFFAGKTMSIFGGIEYQTPIKDLTAKIEYDPTNYNEIIGRPKDFRVPDEIFSVDSRFNYAINYRLNLGNRDKVDLSIGYVRGNTIYANFTTHSNLNYSGPKKIIIGSEELKRSTLEPYPLLNEKWQKYLTNSIIWQLSNAGFITHKVIYNGDELAAEISQGRFKDTMQFIDLASRILANNAPRNIKNITVINIEQGVETLRSTVKKESIYASALKGPMDQEIVLFNQIAETDTNTIFDKNDNLYPNFYWSIRPNALGTIQHQEKFYFWQLEALLHTEYSIMQGLYLTTDIGINIDNNFDEYTYHVTDGELYHVRQNRRLYLTEGETGLRKMSIDYLVDFHKDVKAKFSFGYLEWMYGGIGGEVLYKPRDKAWGIGLDAYWVKQREYDQGFDFKDYETITGHITYYQDIPFYDMRMKVSFGRFLAEDIGTHIDISRRFESGARVGGIVALTDCDADCVGEGSFNKWIYFELPMDLFYINSTTKSRTGYAWTPLTKDAGQKIEPGGLYQLATISSDEIETLRTKSWSMRKIINGFGTEPKAKLN